MKLETDRLTIKPCDHEWAASLSPEDYEIHYFINKYLENLYDDESLLGWGVWFVVEKETGRIVGDIGFKGKPADEMVEVGYGIIPAAQGKGYATESVHRLIEWAFESDEVQKVIAECLDDNYASVKVLEKMNMKRTVKKTTC
jgi:ribosomal-protein-alanine N-acetyltransferase